MRVFTINYYYFNIISTYARQKILCPLHNRIQMPHFFNNYPDQLHDVTSLQIMKSHIIENQMGGFCTSAIVFSLMEFRALHCLPYHPAGIYFKAQQRHCKKEAHVDESKV